MTARRLSIATWGSIAILVGVLAVSYSAFDAANDTARSAPATAAATGATAATATPAAIAATPGPPSPMPTVNRSFVQCAAEAVARPSMLASDACPSAIAAVAAAVASVDLPILEIILEPGPFYCDVVWPGVASPPPGCSGGVHWQPGQYMHAWVSFRGSDIVAAVMLGLDIPDGPAEPGATRPPWSATVVAAEVPPAGWVMP